MTPTINSVTVHLLHYPPEAGSPRKVVTVKKLNSHTVLLFLNCRKVTQMVTKMYEKSVTCGNDGCGYNLYR